MTRENNLGPQARPFDSNQGRPTTFVRYRSQQEAFRFLNLIVTDNRGMGLLHGPELSGKSAAVRQFVDEIQTGQRVAVIDGTRLKKPQLLSAILSQFGYDLESSSDDELLKMLKIFAVQQVRNDQAPLLVIENINAMYPSALSAICELASVSTGNRFALRMILTSSRDFRRIIYSASMHAVEQRMIGDFQLDPLTAKEAQTYLYAKLRCCGVRRPDDIFSVQQCDRIHAAAGGWPGKLDSVAKSFLAAAPGETPQALIEAKQAAVNRVPERVENDAVPKFIVSIDGKTSQEIELRTERAIVGRSDLSDIVIFDKFVSKQHALLVREEGAVVLVDLKSANGTYVNSRRVRRAVLRDNDIISLGDHRMKMSFANSPALATSQDASRAGTDDTAEMMSVADARRKKSNVLHIAEVENKKA